MLRIDEDSMMNFLVLEGILIRLHQPASSPKNSLDFSGKNIEMPVGRGNHPLPINFPKTNFDFPNGLSVNFAEQTVTDTVRFKIDKTANPDQYESPKEIKNACKNSEGLFEFSIGENTFAIDANSTKLLLFCLHYRVPNIKPGKLYYFSRENLVFWIYTRVDEYYVIITPEGTFPASAPFPSSISLEPASNIGKILAVSGVLLCGFVVAFILHKNSKSKRNSKTGKSKSKVKSKLNNKTHQR